MVQFFTASSRSILLASRIPRRSAWPAISRSAWSVALAFAVLSTASAADWTVYLRRVGPLRIGMTLEDVRRVLGDPKAGLAWSGPTPDDAECAYVQSGRLPDGLSLMFQNGRFVRFDVAKPGINTASGVGVGDSEATIEKTYRGKITIGPHKYDYETGGHYVTFTPSDAADRSYSLLFETHDRRVTRFRAGTSAAVALVEGCG